MAAAPPLPSAAFAAPPSPMEPDGQRQHRRLWRPAVLLFGLAISAAIAGIVHNMLENERQSQDEAMRQSLSAGLQSHIDQKLGFVRFLRGLYDSSDFVSVAEFKRFAGIDPAVHDGQSWFAIAWAPHRGGTPETMPRNGTGQAGPGAGDVFPITYLEPAAAMQAGIANAAADPADGAAMRRAALLREMVVSEPHMVPGRGVELKVFMPVFKNGDTASDHIQGFLIAAIAVDGFFSDFLRNSFTDPDLSLRIYDSNSLLFSRGPEKAGRSTMELAFGNQRLRLELGRAGAAIPASFWLPALVFVIGLALTALLYLHLLRADSEYLRISHEVGLATAELAGANAKLADRSATLQRLADDLRQTSQEAQLASAAKTVFLANMSHELRTPLNAIIGFAEVIAHRTLGEHSPRYCEYATDIEGSGRYLLSIIEDLLDMSRIDLGQLHLTEETVIPQKLIRSVIKFVSHRAQEKRIAIQLEGFDPLPRIQADARSLRQALVNLLINAIKFSPAGSAIVVHGAMEADGGIALAVQDSGPGIKPEAMASIFEPFWQGDAYRRKPRDGVGLGLAITKRLIEAHGGVVELISGPGQGTRAVIRLPATRVLRGRPQLSVVASGGNAA